MAEGPADPGAEIDFAEATRWEILQHAEDLFGHYGFSKTNMADIARRSGMSPGNLYRYYRNKQAIGIAVIEAFLRRSEAAILTAMGHETSPEGRIRALISEGVAQLVDEMIKVPKIMELMEFLMTEETAFAVVQAHIAWKRELVMEELEKGVAAGEFEDQPAYDTAVNLMHATKAFQTPFGLSSWRDFDTVMPELEGVLDLIFAGVRVR